MQKRQSGLIRIVCTVNKQHLGKASQQLQAHRLARHVHDIGKVTIRILQNRMPPVMLLKQLNGSFGIS